MISTIKRFKCEISFRSTQFPSSQNHVNAIKRCLRSNLRKPDKGDDIHRKLSRTEPSWKDFDFAFAFVHL